MAAIQLDALTTLLIESDIALTSGLGNDAAAPSPDLIAPLLDAIDTIVFVADPRGSLRYVNAAWTRLTGYTLADTRELSPATYLHPQDRQGWGRLLDARSHEKQAGAAVTLRFLMRSGDTIHLEAAAKPVVKEAGRCLGFVGTLSDVGGRVQAEGLKQASHRTLDTLINNLPGLVYRCRNNRQWTMEYMSKGCEVLTGYPPEALINNEILTFADLILPADREQVWENVQVALREHRPFELMYRIRTAVGEEKWVLERGRGNFSISGELLGLEGFITDITEERHEQIRLRSDSLHDAVTGLPTPALFLDRLEMSLRRSGKVAGEGPVLFVIHLDQFAKWRATLSTEFKDFALRDVGRRLGTVLTDLDTICRWNESEFAVLRDAECLDADAIAVRFQQVLRAPVVDGSNEIFLTASIGVATGLSVEDHAEDAVSLATTAAARARNAGMGRIEVIDAGSALQRSDSTRKSGFNAAR